MTRGVKCGNLATTPKVFYEIDAAWYDEAYFAALRRETQHKIASMAIMAA
jgi:hypothetical protein